MSSQLSACVYCGSSHQVPEIYKQAARELGIILAKNNIRLVFGGGKTGLMGILSKSVLEAGGHVTGVMTRFLCGYEGLQEDMTDLHICESMHERKQKMFESSDNFIILPGGLGTLDETFEVMTWKQVGLHDKRIIIVDIDGYWGDLFDKFMGQMIRNKFVREEDRKLFKIVPSVDDVLQALNETQSHDKNYVAKWG